MTSSAEVRDIRDSYEEGVNSYIVKPVEFEQFSETVAKAGFYWSSGTMTGTGKTVVGTGVTAGVIHTVDYGYNQPVLDRMDDALTQFVCQRRTEYLSIFSEIVGSLKA